MASKLTGFFRGLLGSGEREDDTESATGEAIEYNGYFIRPAPRRQGGQWLTAGVILSDETESAKEHVYVRAETHASKDDAVAFAITKAKQIIDEQGDRLFKDG